MDITSGFSGSTGGIAGAIGAIAALVCLLLSRKYKNQDANVDSRKATQEALQKALAEGRITDAAVLRRRLQQLGGAIALACLLGLSGCVTPDASPLVVGERVMIVKPGPVVVPEVKAPAKTWYLVDDVGLAEWLGIVPTIK